LKKSAEGKKSSAAVIRAAVERYLEQERELDRENDPIFKLEGLFEGAEGDLSVNHDHDLYGAPKKNVGKRHG